MFLISLFKHGSSNGGLIAFYVNLGNMETARKVFDVLPQRGIDAWNAMIIVHSRKEYPVGVPCLYHRIIFGRSDSSTFTVALKACMSLADLKTGEEI
ncbi:putative pentatricopeptide repeat-containing protein [Quercus suber]|uniref:Pentatricopeptide repeat-containing protein n=1 Tax=Quercus suber TaxID=58331 RepID=A0AAW0KSL5_QUESU